MAQGSYKYFASPSDVPSEDIGTELMARLQEQMAADFGRERRQKWAQAYRHRFGFDFGAGSTSEVLRDGEQGELSKVRVNNSTTTQQALLGLLLSPRFTWRPIARNRDTGARSAQHTASNLLEYYWRVRRMARAVSKWADKGIRYGEAYIFPRWDDTQGPEVLPDGPEMEDGQLSPEPDVDDMPMGAAVDESGIPLPGEATPPPQSGQQTQTQPPMPGVTTPTRPPRMLRDGDFVFHVVSPWDHFTDEEATDGEEPQWRAIRLWLPRADVLALWPQTIDGSETASSITAQAPRDTTTRMDATLKRSADRVPVFFFFHSRTAAVPNGRETVLVNAKCVLADGPLSYKRNPIVRFAPEEQDDSPHGYTTNFDQLGIQDVIDGLESAVATNQLTLAVQSIVMEEGTKAGPDETHGMRVFYKKPGAEPPSALNLTNTPKEVFENLERLPGRQRDIMGLNDVSMGQPETAQMNAEAFALLAGMATQRNSPKQQALLDSVGELGSVVLGELQARVTTERMIAIAGKASGQYQEEYFTGDDVAGVEQVVVEVGNLLEQSVAGRFQLAQLFLNAGVKMTPDDITQVVETGRIDVATNPIRAQDLLISHENDELSEGRDVPVSIFDDAAAHCIKHKATLDDPQTRRNPAAVKAIQRHIDAHYVEFYGLPPQVDPMTGQPAPVDPKAMDPMYPMRIRMLLGQQPPQMMAPPTPGGPQSAPSGDAGATPDVAPTLQPPTAPGVGSTVNPMSGAPAGPPM